MSIAVASRLGSGLLGNFSAQLFALLVQLVVALVSVRIFATLWGLETYGSWLILLTLPATIALIDLGFIGAVGSAMTAQVARGQSARARLLFRQLTSAGFLAGSTALVLLAVVLLPDESAWPEFASQATSGKTGETLFALGCYAIFALWSRILYTALRATGHFARGAYAIALAALLEIVFAAGLALAGGGLAGAALGLAAGQAAGLAIMGALLRRHAPQFRPALAWAGLSQLRPLARPALALVVVALGQAAILQGMVVILGMAAGPAAVPAFVAARTLARSGLQAVAVASQAIMPELTRARAGNASERVRDLVALNLSTGLAIAVPASIGLAVFGPTVIHYWSGGVIGAGRDLTAIMALAMLLGCLWTPLASFLTADNQQGRFAYALAVVALFANVTAYALGLGRGAVGAATAMLLLDGAMLVRTLQAASSAGFLAGLPLRSVPLRAIGFLYSRFDRK